MCDPGSATLRICDDVDLARGAHDGVGDGRIGDEDLRRVLGEVDDGRLADAHSDSLRIGVERSHDLALTRGRGDDEGRRQRQR